MSNLKEIKLEYKPIPEDEQMKLIDSSAHKTYIRGDSDTMVFKDAAIRKFTKSTTFLGKKYYITEFDSDYNKSEYGIEESSLSKAPDYESFINPRYMTLKYDTERFNPYTGQITDTLSKGRNIKFTTKIQIGDKWYYRTEHNTVNGINAVVESSSVSEAPQYENFLNPRNMILVKDTNRINPYTGELYDTLEAGRTVKFSTKINIDGSWYYRTEHNTTNGIDAVVPANSVEELH